MKVLYVPGPLNVVQSYCAWLSGQDDLSSVSIPYLQQFFDLCRDRGLQSIVCSTTELDQSNLDESIINNSIEFAYIAPLFSSSSGALFHLGQVLYLMQLGFTALWHRADVIVVTAARAHLFALFPFTWVGVKVIPALHCTFWPKFYAPSSLVKRIVLALTGSCLRSMNSPILAFPGEVSQQVDRLTKSSSAKIFKFLPTYHRQVFQAITPPNTQQNVFHVLYLGRVTQDKGVYTILEIAEVLRQRTISTQFVFDICGEGPELIPLRQRVAQLGLSARVKCHGYCDRNQVTKMLCDSHILIVPTTKSFIEGFNKVVVEGVLSNRPVVTSSVCPSLETVREAVFEVEAEGTAEQYAEAISQLKFDRDLYLQKQAACSRLQSQFYERELSWGTQLDRALSYLEGQKQSQH